MPDPARRPAWVADAVFYQVFPDRFARSARVAKPGNLQAWDAPPTRHAYKGGDLLGVVERLDWIAGLGANAIYLNPIFTSASNHRYHTHDYFSVDPMLGGDAAFDELIGACRERGIRVVLDGVFNHASRGFYYFNDLLENGAESAWVDWFTVRAFPVNAYQDGVEPNYSAWWNDHALPKLNTENPEVREYLMTVAEHWVARGAAGWRLDVPEEIATEGFWEEMRRRVRAVDPDAYLVGEIWDDAGAWVSDGSRFDGTMNYRMTEAILRFAGRDTLDEEICEPVNLTLTPPLDAAGYAEAVETHLGRYPWEAHLANLNLLGSHDTPRFRSMLGEDDAAEILALALLFTFPGAPSVYYGDEVGMTGAHDPFCRGGFPWDDPGRRHDAVLDAHRSLIALRHAEPSLRTGAYRTVAADGSAYAFARGGRDGVLVAANAGAAEASLDVGGVGERLWGAGTAVGGTVTLPGRSAAVWRLA